MSSQQLSQPGLDELASWDCRRQTHSIDHGYIQHTGMRAGTYLHCDVP
jgi:hypothetical protein